MHQSNNSLSIHKALSPACCFLVLHVLYRVTCLYVYRVFFLRRQRKTNRLKREQLRNRKKEENVYNDDEVLTESNNLKKRVVDINPRSDQSGYAVPAEVIPGVIPRSFNTPGSYKVSHAVARNEDDDGYAIPGEVKSEVISIPIPGFFNTPGACEVSDVVADNEDDDGYAVPGEAKSEVIAIRIPGFFNTLGDCEVSHAVADNEDVNGYLLPVEKTLGKTPGRRQRYQALDVLRRKDEENEYQSLVGVERSSKSGSSDDVDKPADGT